MTKVFLPPLVTAGVLAAMAWSGTRLETYDLNSAFHCSHEVATLDRPAADILFVGNSQTGAGVDQAYVQNLIDPQGTIKVEKLAIVQANIVALRMLVEDYVEHRGAPDIVVFQPMVVRAEHWQAPAGLPIHPRADLAFQDWDELVEVQSTAKPNPTGSWLPPWMEKGYRTLPAVWADRQVERFMATLTYPRIVLVRDACRTEAKYQLANDWPYGLLPLEEGEDPGPVVDQAKFQEWSHDVSQRKAASALSPSRGFEMDQHRKLLAALETAGSEVILVGYPSMGQASQDAKEFAEFGKALGRDVIDIRSILAASERQEIEHLYRDPLHVNLAGAEIFSSHLARMLKGRVK